MAQVTAEMASEYRRIFARTAEDPGTAGDEGEENRATLLREWLPPAYHVTTKGRLIGEDGTYSPQIDVLVLKPFYPAKFREKKTWLAGGVAAAFECKTTLRAEHLADSAERCRKFKELMPKRAGTPARELRSPLVYGILAHSHAWKAPASKPAENLRKALWEILCGASHPADMIDVVCVSDVGCWSEMSMPFYRADWKPDAEAYLTSAFGGSWGPSTSMMEAAVSTENQRDNFQPVGALISYLTQRLAWADTSIRDLADYYRRAKLWGSGSGSMRHWPQSIFSDGVRQGIESGNLKNDGEWSEWNVALV